MLSGLPSQGAWAVFWLAMVVGLILVVSRLAARLPALRRVAVPEGALALRGSLALDSRRRLHLVDAGGCRALILTGGASDVLVSLPPAGC